MLDTKVELLELFCDFYLSTIKVTTTKRKITILRIMCRSFIFGSAFVFLLFQFKTYENTDIIVNTDVLHHVGSKERTWFFLSLQIFAVSNGCPI